MSTPEKRKRTVEWDEANLAKNFAERSATMKIDEIETPWHSPPRELFHDLSVEDEGRAPREDVAIGMFGCGHTKCVSAALLPRLRSRMCTVPLGIPICYRAAVQL